MSGGPGKEKAHTGNGVAPGASWTQPEPPPLALQGRQALRAIEQGYLASPSGSGSSEA